MAAGRKSGRAPFVPLVQPAHLWTSQDWTLFGSHHGARNWRIFVEREMCSGTFVIVDVGGNDAAQPTRVEDDDVIETLSAD